MNSAGLEGVSNVNMRLQMIANGLKLVFYFEYRAEVFSDAVFHVFFGELEKYVRF